MADEDDRGGAFEHDELVTRLSSDPATPPDAVMLAGFLGPSTRERHQRLYLNASLSRYVEVPEDAIVHTETLPRKTAPLGGTLLWVRRGTQLAETEVVTNQVQAEFLAGEVAATAAPPGTGVGEWAPARQGVSYVCRPNAVYIGPSIASPHCGPIRLAATR